MVCKRKKSLNKKLSHFSHYWMVEWAIMGSWIGTFTAIYILTKIWLIFSRFFVFLLFLHIKKDIVSFPFQMTLVFFFFQTSHPISNEICHPFLRHILYLYFILYYFSVLFIRSNNSYFFSTRKFTSSFFYTFPEAFNFIDKHSHACLLMSSKKSSQVSNFSHFRIWKAFRIDSQMDVKAENVSFSL